MKVFGLFFSTMIVYYGVQAVTFEEAVVAAHSSNNEWFASQAEKKMADETLSQSKMMFLPSIQGTVSTSRNRVETVQTSNNTYNQMLDIDNPTTSRGTIRTTNTQIGVTISQNIFNGFSIINTVKANKNSAKAAYHKLKFEEQSLITKVLDAYTSIWVGRQKVAALKKKEENLEKILDSQNGSLDAGIGTPAEVAQANANYQKAIYERISAETELRVAESEFEKLTGLKADKDLELPDLNINLPKSLDKLISQAMSSNHSMKYYKLMGQSEVNKLDAARGKLLPSCDLTLRTVRSLRKQKYNNSDNDYSASLEVIVPIFSNSPSSGNSYSAIAIANQQALKARFSAEETMLEIKKECVVNWNRYISANAMIKSSRSAVRSAELSSKNNLEETAMGLKSNTEVWDKENRLLESRIDLANSRKQKIIAAMQLYALTGNLDLNSILKKK